MSEAPLRIGVTCYPTFGGSGIIATEIGLSLARRGHQVHFICYDEPGRLARLEAGVENVRFHRVEVPDYPLPHLSPYPLTLASAMAEVTCSEGLDLLHVHYALPHGVSAYLARQMVAAAGARPPRVVTTLHGTDVTLLGAGAPFLPITRFALLHSDGLTAPSIYLRRAACLGLGLPAETAVEVIPNFVDTERFRPRAGAPPAGRPVLVHGSNFRPLKRVEDVVRIFALVARAMPARLLLVGDGPDRPRAEALVRELGLADAVRFLGMRLDVAEVLRQGDLFLLPSESEGFGLAALEALSCGLPVVGSHVGGVPEVVADGETGLLYDAGDLDGMAAGALRILTDDALRARMSRAARAMVEARWRQEPMVTRYERYYRRILAGAKA